MAGEKEPVRAVQGHGAAVVELHGLDALPRELAARINLGSQFMLLLGDRGMGLDDLAGRVGLDRIELFKLGVGDSESKLTISDLHKVAHELGADLMLVAKEDQEPNL